MNEKGGDYVSVQGIKKEKTIIKCDRIYTSQGCLDGAMILCDGVVEEFLDAPVHQWDFDYTGYQIYPGLIDTHNHGNCGFSLREKVVDEQQRVQQIQSYLENLSIHGITGVFPTCSIENISCVEKASHFQVEGAKILGIHVEGPWLKRAGEKGKAAVFSVPDRQTAEKMVVDAKGMLKQAAFSPEIEHIEEVAEVLRQKGIKLSLAHTSCTYEQAKEAIDRLGYDTVTHVGNAMSGIHHRDVGTLGAALLDKELMCEIICDFVHLCPQMVQLILEMKGSDHLMMVSDNSHLTGLPKGKYYFADGTIENDGLTRITTDTGKIQGSNCFVDYGLKNLAQKLHYPMEHLWKITSYNACRHYGIEKKGKLEKNYSADFVVLNNDLEVIKTFVEGVQVYEKGQKELKYHQEFIEKNKC